MDFIASLTTDLLNQEVHVIALLFMILSAGVLIMLAAILYKKECEYAMYEQRLKQLENTESKLSWLHKHIPPKTFAGERK